MKRKLHRYNINRPMLRHGDKYTHTLNLKFDSA